MKKITRSLSLFHSKNVEATASYYYITIVTQRIYAASCRIVLGDIETLRITQALCVVNVMFTRRYRPADRTVRVCVRCP